MNKALTVLRVGGVPEHFNAPWLLAAAKHSFEAAGVDLEFKVFPGGSGAMSAALRDGSIDVACMLTEAAVAEAHATSQPLRVVGAYTTTPLTWGVHVAAGSRFAQGRAAHPPRVFAVSRFGSGSHLMALVDADLRGAPAPERFEVVGSLEGARAALREGSADAFMWEKFTTKPLVDSGEWVRVADVPTPWPCFSVAGTEERLRTVPREALLATLKVARAEALNLERNQASAAPQIAQLYGLQTVDVAEWLTTTRWECAPTFDRSVLTNVQDKLVSAGILDKKALLAPEAIVSDFTILA